MNLSAPFIRRPVMTILVMLAIFIVGSISFFKLPISDLPSIDYPTIQVSASYNGASPETMADTVATPLEKQFMAIQGIQSVSSSSTLGVTDITLQFEIDKNIDIAAVDVQTAISRAQIDLPKNMTTPPTFKKVNPSDAPILYIAITSATLSLAEIYDYGHNFIAQRLSSIAGVAQVQTYGAPYALRINVDPDLIATKGITLTDISEAVIRAVPNLPSGQLDGPFKTEIIESKGQLINAAQMDPVIIRYQNGAPVRIQDIGHAENSLNDIRYHLWYVGAQGAQTGIFLAINKQPGSNTLKVAREVKAKLPILIEQLPKSIDVSILFDRSISIEDSVYEIELTLIIALFLVIFVIYFYLNKVTDTLIPSLAMPMSIILTFAVMRYFNFSIDNLSLLALTLATGFIVDDAIVVLENVVRRVEGGEDRFKASMEGAKQISFTIFSMTLSLAAVFVPLIFMYGLIGKIFFEFSVVMVVVILASGLISLTLTPMLTSLLLSERKDKTVGKIGAFSQKFNNALQEAYNKSLVKAMERQKEVLFIGSICLILSLFFFWYLPKDFLPNDDIGFFKVFVVPAQGTSPDQMFVLQNQVNEVIQRNPGIQSFLSYADTKGFALVVLKPYSERESLEKIVAELYQAFKGIPGVEVFIKAIPLINLSLGTFSQGAYQYTLSSLNTDALFKSADLFLDRLKQIPGFIGVSSDLEVATPMLQVEILRDEASSLGVEAIDIENALQLAFGGGAVTQIDGKFDQYDIIVELMPGFRGASKDLDSLWVRSRLTQKLVPLSSVAKWTETIGATSINHILQAPAVTIAFSLAPGFPLSTALEKLKELSKEVLPPDVVGQSYGAASSFESSVAYTALLFLGSIAAIYIILGILYESFIHPLTILSSLPPAILGGLLTLWLFGLPLSLYSFLGLMLLIGIVKKNGILVVDFALENIRLKNEDAKTSVLEACRVRFRPIMMTTMAAIMGALPIALGIGPSADSRRPLGLVIIGGLLLSQLITLYLTPVVYLHLEALNKKVSFKRPKEELYER